MLAIILISVSLLSVAFGTAVHFWILARIERAGVRVKYFANLWDNVRAYGAYRQLARDHGWPMWPSYAVFAVYVGVVIAAVSFYVSSSFLDFARPPK